MSNHNLEWDKFVLHTHLPTPAVVQHILHSFTRYTDVVAVAELLQVNSKPTQQLQDSVMAWPCMSAVISLET